ncbi:MAG: hypothetical protein ABS36_09340 [Acidobacteria bacterium SCN 69-37]|nr:MAG: hypothetical protein ABS36_09340 [Acidobacteria bacterium SCN 69-37]
MAPFPPMIAATLTRFAPAPTGFLHLGHVVNAIYVWGLARRFGARVILRIEDHDAQRSRPAYEAALLDDLAWLGFEADAHPAVRFDSGHWLCRQRDRQTIYHVAAERLRAAGLLYGCTCTRQDIAARQHGRGAYPGTCRSRHLPLDGSTTWRVRLDGGPETFVDLLQGPCTGDAAHLGDPAIRDRHGNWTYTFAVVVDDLEQGIDLVVRGDDLQAATAAQIRLGRLLGRPRPARFAHHPLLMKSSTQKLSKADNDTGIRDMRRAGWNAARVIGHAAARAGLVPAGAVIPATDVGSLAAALQLASD